MSATAEKNLATLVEQGADQAKHAKLDQLHLHQIAAALEAIERRGRARFYYGRVAGTVFAAVFTLIMIAALPLIALLLTGLLTLPFRR